MRSSLSLALAFLLPAAALAAPGLVKIQPDQASYEIGNRAVIFLRTDHGPMDPTKEFFFDFRVDGKPVNSIQLSDRLSVALPGRFLFGGERAIEASVYLQDKSRQRSLEKGEGEYLSKLWALKNSLEAERDPEKRALLKSEIRSVEKKVDAIRSERSATRRLVGVNLASLSVFEPARAQKPGALAPVFTLTASRDPAVYEEGEQAEFTLHLNSRFAGPDGPREHLVRGKIGAAALAPLETGNDFLFTSGFFGSEDIGSQSFDASLAIRSQAQADLLREAQRWAAVKRNRLQREHDKAVSPGERAYLSQKVGEISLVIGAISDRLEECLVLVDASSLEFTVTEAVK